MVDRRLLFTTELFQVRWIQENPLMDMHLYLLVVQFHDVTDYKGLLLYMSLNIFQCPRLPKKPYGWHASGMSLVVIARVSYAWLQITCFMHALRT